MNGFNGKFMFINVSLLMHEAELLVDTMYSAPVSRAFWTFCSAMAVEMGSNFTENVPPNPQHTSFSFISFNSMPLLCPAACEVRLLSHIPSGRTGIMIRYYVFESGTHIFFFQHIDYKIGEFKHVLLQLFVFIMQSCIVEQP